MSSEEYRFRTQVDRVHDIVGADVPRDLLKIAIEEQDAQVAVKLASALIDLGIEDTNGDQIDPATEQTVDSLAADLDALAAALASDGSDTLQVEGGTATLAQQTTLSALAAALASNGTDSLQVEGGTATLAQQTTLSSIENTVDSNDTLLVNIDSAQGASPVTATAGGTGAANAATLSLGSTRRNVDVFYDTSGAATITIEVSKDGSTWRQFQQVSPGSAETDVIQFDTAYSDVRAYIDQNLNTLEASGKGL